MFKATIQIFVRSQNVLGLALISQPDKLVWWPSGQSEGLVVKRLLVQIPYTTYKNHCLLQGLAVLSPTPWVNKKLSFCWLNFLLQYKPCWLRFFNTSHIHLIFYVPLLVYPKCIIKLGDSSFRLQIPWLTVNTWTADSHPYFNFFIW